MQHVFLRVIFRSPVAARMTGFPAVILRRALMAEGTFMRSTPFMRRHARKRKRRHLASAAAQRVLEKLNYG